MPESSLDATNSFTKKYSYGLSYKILLGIFGPPLIGLFIWVGYESIQKFATQPYIAGFVIVLSIIMIMILILGLIDVFISKLIIHKDRFKVVDLFGQKEILFTEIKGYRQAEISSKYQRYTKYIIIPKDKYKKNITFPSNIAKSREAINYLKTKFKNLDELDEQVESKELFSNKKFGSTPVEVEQNLIKLKHISTSLNYLSIATTLWVMIFPYPYNLAVTICIIIPISGVLLVNQSHGYLTLSEKVKKNRSLASAISLPPIALALRAFIDINIIDYLKQIFYFSIATILLVASQFKTLYTTKTYGINKYLHFFLMLLLTTLYFYSSITMLNSIYDQSVGTVYQTVVISKHVNKGSKRSSYYLKLSPWGQIETQREVKVSTTLYAQIVEGDNISITQKNGLFGIQWFYLGK